MASGWRSTFCRLHRYGLLGGIVPPLVTTLLEAAWWAGVLLWACENPNGPTFTPPRVVGFYVLGLVAQVILRGPGTLSLKKRPTLDMRSEVTEAERAQAEQLEALRDARRASARR